MRMTADRAGFQPARAGPGGVGLRGLWAAALLLAAWVGARPGRAGLAPPAGEAAVPDGALPVLRISAPPEIDGRLEEALWAGAARAAGFLDVARPNTPFDRQTSVRLAYDGRALYVGAECLEPAMSGLVASVTGRDGPVFGDDCLELFLDTNRDRRMYYQLAFNALGACWDGVRRSGAVDASWDSGVTAAVRRLPDRWVLEAAVPFERMQADPPGEGTLWGFNAGREHRVGDSVAFSSWAALPSGKGFGHPEDYAPLAFAGADIPAGRRTLTRQRPAIQNPDFFRLDAGGKPVGWTLGPHAAVRETAYLSEIKELCTEAGSLLARQAADFRAVAGRDLEVSVAARGEAGGTLGLALVYETRAGAEARLRAFWDQPLGPEPSRHTVVVTVPETAERITGVELYRSSGRGRVAVRSVGLADVAARFDGIRELAETFQDYRLPVGEPFVSECVPWANPLAGGPLRVLVIEEGEAREAVELAQRVEMDLDVCCVEKGVLMAYGAGAIMARLARELPPYDVILLASPVRDPALMQTLKQNVRAGTGLVFIRRSGDRDAGADLADALPETCDLAAAEPPPARGVPWRHFPAITDPPRSEPAVKGMGVAASPQAGGRVVELVYGGLVPLRRLLPRTGNNESDLPGWWDYAYSLLGKSLVYAASRPAPASIGSLSAHPDRGQLVLGLVVTNAIRGWRLCVEWDDAGGLVRVPATELPLSAGPGETRIEIPVPPVQRRLQGLRLANVRLKDGAGRVADWATAAFSVTGALQIAARHPFARDAFKDDEAVSGSVTLENGGGAAEALTLDLSLTDARGRVVWTRSSPVSLEAGSRRDAAVAPDLDRAMTVYHRLRAVLRDAGGPRAFREWDLFLPDRWAFVWEDFRLGANAGYFHRAQPDGPITRWLQQHGMTYATEGGVFDAAPRLDMPWQKINTVHPPFHYDKGGPVREPCLNDPAVLKAAAGAALDDVRRTWKYGSLAYMIADESELARDGRAEVCFCPRCAAAFRAWARERYATLGRANAEWETDYASWDAVQPVSAEEARRRGRFAQWVDYRVFMEDTFVGAFLAVKEAVRAEFPDARWSFTNPFGLNPFSGSDHYKLALAEDVFLKYVRPDLVKEYRSFKPGAPMISFFGYTDDVPACRYFPWWFAFHGGDVCVWWDAVRRDKYSLFDDWGRHTPRSLAVLESGADLLAGAGKILHDCPAAPTPVAMLHSHASMHVAWIESDMRLGVTPWSEGESAGPIPPPNLFQFHELSVRHLKAMVKETAQQPEMIVPDQILAGCLDGGRFRLLILPCATALSDEAIERMAGFVRDGGVLLADARAGLYSGNGRRLETRPALEALFGFRRAGSGPVSNAAAPASWSGPFSALQGLACVADGFGREDLDPTTATPCARHVDGAPAVLVNAVGRGQAVYLNFVPGRGPLYNGLMQAVLDLAGIEPPVRLTAGGRPPFGYECFPFRRGPMEYLGLLRDLEPVAPGEPYRWFRAEFRNAAPGAETLDVRLPAARHVYDVRKGRYLGFREVFRTAMPPGEAALFGLLPYRVAGVAVAQPPDCRAGGRLRIQAAVAVDGGRFLARLAGWARRAHEPAEQRAKPGDHALRLEITDPDGKRVPHYSKNVLARSGRYEEDLPLALNEKPGRWRLMVTDVASGLSVATAFAVSQAEAE